MRDVPFPRPHAVATWTPMVADPLAKLHEVFGYSQFRGVQEQVVDRVLGKQR